MNNSYVKVKQFEDICLCDTSLKYLSPLIARDITSSLIKDITQGVRIHLERIGKTQKQLEWVMEVICYGMSLPLSDIELIKSCANIYITWITNYITNAIEIPELIIQDWDYYFNIILLHLRNLFIPRFGANSSLHASVCARVLTLLRTLVTINTRTPSTYDAILQFLLIVTSKVLCSAPNITISSHSFADNLCDELSSHFYFIWISISVRHFPSDSLWRSFTSVASHCLHNHKFVFQWASFCLLLTKEMFNINFTQNNKPNIYLEFQINQNCIPPNTNHDLILHLWLRILHSVGNISKLSRPLKLCKKYWPELQTCSYTLPSEWMERIDSSGKSKDLFISIYLMIEKTLPRSFNISIQLIACLVQLFIPYIQLSRINFNTLKSQLLSPELQSSPQTVRNSTYEDNVYLNMSDVLQRFLSMVDSSVVPYDSPNINVVFSNKITTSQKICHTKCNTLLNIISDWILSSCMNFKDILSIREPSNVVNIDSLLKINIDLSKPCINEYNPLLSLNNDYEIGRAEAFSLMLRLITTEPDNQFISPIYLSHFYTLLPFGLMYQQTEAWILLRSIIFSSLNLFTSNVIGVNILIPHYLRAINLIVTQPQISNGKETNPSNIRYACMRIMNSILPICLNICHLGCDDISDITEVVLSFKSITLYIIDTLNDGFVKESDSRILQIYLTVMSTLVYEFHERRNTSSFLPNEKSIQESKSSGSFNSKNNSGEFKSKTSPSLLKYFFSTSFNHVSDRLTSIASLKTVDLSLSLSLLDFIGLLSIFDQNQIPQLVCINIIIFICNYIEKLANKPPIMHSRDLHSIIVSAYNSILSWLKNHKWLFLKQTCLDTILQIIEFGLSGSKSDYGQSPETITKENKLIKPISLRVRDISEYILLLILEHMPFYNQFQDSSAENILTENYFLQNIPLNSPKSKIHSFFLGNFAIISTIDLRLSNDDLNNKYASVVVFVRSIMGKHVYYFENKSFLNIINDIEIILQLENTEIMAESETSFSGDLNKLYSRFHSYIAQDCIAEKAFPILSKISYKTIPNFTDLLLLYENQLNQSNKYFDSYSESIKILDNFGITKQAPATFNGKYDSFRILLNNLSMIRFRSIKEYKTYSIPHLYDVEISPDFMANLSILDKISVRNTEFVYLFILPSEVNNVEDILTNKKTLYSSAFNNFINQLGCEMTVKEHNGYLGPFDKNGKENYHFVYYADLLNELIIIPSYSIFENNLSSDNFKMFKQTQKVCLSRTLTLNTFDSGDSTITKTASFCEEIKKDAINNQDYRLQSLLHGCGIILMWVDNHLELNNILINQMIYLMNEKFKLTNTEFNPHLIIIINPMQNGYFLIRNICITPDKQVVTTSPLRDETVLSMNILGKVIRNCIFSYVNKRKLQLDLYSSPNLKRKYFIQNMSKSIGSSNEELKSFENLFDL